MPYFDEFLNKIRMMNIINITYMLRADNNVISKCIHAYIYMVACDQLLPGHNYMYSFNEIAW